MSERCGRDGRSAAGWRVCTTYQERDGVRVEHKAEQVRAVFWPDRAVVLPDGPTYRRDGSFGSYLGYQEPRGHVIWVLFDDKAVAEDYAERQELRMRIHEMVVRRDALRNCSADQLRTVYEVLSNPSMAPRGGR